MFSHSQSISVVNANNEYIQFYLEYFTHTLFSWFFTKMDTAESYSFNWKLLKHSFFFCLLLVIKIVNTLDSKESYLTHFLAFFKSIGGR